jgi:hypothetical protein
VKSITLDGPVHSGDRGIERRGRPAVPKTSGFGTPPPRTMAPRSNTAGLQGQRRDLQAQAQRLVNAIAKSGDSPSLLSGLAEVESALGQLDQQLKMQSPIDLEGTLVEIREFVSKNLFQLRAFLAGDPL